jgi:hypothetical protein
LIDGDVVGKPVPPVDAGRITDVAAVQIEIGRGEVGVLRLGLYGKDHPESVRQLVDFLSSTGLSTQQVSSDAMGAVSVPVSLSRGGVIDSVVPGRAVDFGVPSQAAAYAKSRGRSKAGDAFAPQGRPQPIGDDGGYTRPHDVAGLVSVPSQGLGYGGGGSSTDPDDTCFASAFLITADALPEFDKPSGKSRRRRVIGQVLDEQSMTFLERLSNIPTQRGIRGVIPGQTAGPPLPKVVVRDVTVAAVARTPL